MQYYGIYSSKKSDQHLKKMIKPASVQGGTEPVPSYRRRSRITWDAFIKAVYEVNPLKCLTWGRNMKVLSFIEDEMVIEKIQKHCNLWDEEPARPPPDNVFVEKTVSD